MLLSEGGRRREGGGMGWNRVRGEDNIGWEDVMG